MIVYRVINNNELLSYLRNTKYINNLANKRVSTFNYEKDKNYIHFFKYKEHAINYIKDKGIYFLAEFDVPDSILENLEYSFYKGFVSNIDDSLKNICIPIPEYVLDREYFVNEFFNKVITIQNSSEYVLKIRLKKFLKEDVDIEFTSEDIYYELIKNLLNEFNNDLYKVIDYLKITNIDEEIDNYTTKISDNKKYIKSLKNSR